MQGLLHLQTSIVVNLRLWPASQKLLQLVPEFGILLLLMGHFARVHIHLFLLNLQLLLRVLVAAPFDVFELHFP